MMNPNISKKRGEKPNRNTVVFRNNRMGIGFLFLVSGVLVKNYAFLKYLKVRGWKSDYPSIQKVLTYIEKCCDRNEATLVALLFPVYKLCMFTKFNPEELIKKDKTFLDGKIKEYLFSIPHTPTAGTYETGLKRFFRENNRMDLDYPRFSPPDRDEIIKYPITLEDAWKMVRHAGSLKAALLILLLFTTGIRNSTIRAIKYGIVTTKNPFFKKCTLKDELSEGEKNPMIVIYRGMRKWVPRACKRNLFYYSFVHECVLEYLFSFFDDRVRRYGKMDDEEFLFPSESRKLPHDKKCTTPMSDSNINEIVKKAAYNAGLENWREINASTLRDLFYETLKDQYLITGMSFEDRVFLMGQKIRKPTENYFSMYYIKKMRKKFAKLNFSPGSHHNNAYLEMLARSHGINYDYAIECAKERYGDEPTEKETENIINELIDNMKDHIVAEESDLPKLLKEGYKLEHWSPTKKVLMSKNVLQLHDVAPDENINGNQHGNNTLSTEQIKESHMRWVEKKREKKDKKRQSGQQDLNRYSSNN